MGWNVPEPPLEPREEPMYTCPVCGEELNFDDKVYVNCAGRVVGCCMCLAEEAAGDELEK